MSIFLQLAFLIAVILLAAKAAGYLSVRLGQPSVLGELLVGILLGPSLLDLLHLPFIEGEKLGETIKELGELGVLLLMFIAGLELHLNELTRNTKVSALAGIMGVLTPVALGTGTGLLFGFDTNAALFLGLTLGATSVSISAQTLMELRVLRTRVGLGLLGAAVFDDVMIILLLSIFLAVITGGTSVVGILLILGKMILFLAVSTAFGLYVLPKLVRVTRRLPISQGVLSLAMVILLFYGVAAEVVGGMAAITGSFLAGLMFARCEEKERLEQGVSALAYGLFVPIFFVSIGLEVNIRDLEGGALLLTAVIILVAIASKFFGSGLGARWAGFTWRESWQMGAGMVSRGEVGLIVANVGIGAGLVGGSEFSAIVGMVLATTIVTPPMLRALFAEPKKTSGEMIPAEGKEA
ncbi:MAG: cation:proton antiporter [Anaerolineales bacterium]|jgi:Kef-type K+ transport system membrane component KefB